MEYAPYVGRSKGGEVPQLHRPRFSLNRKYQEKTTMSNCSQSLAEPRDAQFVMASLVSSDTTRGELRFAPRSASIASELARRVIAIGWHWLQIAFDQLPENRARAFPADPENVR